MTEAEALILKNQVEIMWAISYLLKCVKPDLVGKAGELDMMRDDLHHAAKGTKAFVNQQSGKST
jgi:hypothetical protein